MSVEARELIADLTEADQNDYRIATARKQAGYLTVAQVAEALCVSRMTIYRMCQAGEMPSIRVGRQYRIPCGDYAKWVLARPAQA